MLLFVGSPLPNYRIMPEGAQFFHDYAGSPFLMLFYDDIGPAEIRAINTGKIRLGLVRAGDHTIFLMFEIEGFTVGWAEAIFSMGRVPPESRQYDHVPDGQGWLFSIMLVERSTGIIKAMRAGSITPWMTKKLQEALDDLAANVSSYTEERHLSEIQAMYERYPKVTDMVHNEAVVVETFGRPFPKRDV